MNEMKLLFFVIALVIAGFANASRINQHKAFDRAIKFHHSQQYNFKKMRLSQSAQDCTKTIKKNCDKGRESIA